jgi:ABC-type lipoprotein release transport system permease subunit
VISIISVVGQVVGTAALIIVLSVFNGFEDVIKSMYNTFNPNFVITTEQGKTFSYSEFPAEKLKTIPGVIDLASVVEEDALFKYRDQQYIAKIKGVSENYTKLSQLDKLMREGNLVFQEGNSNFAVVGAGVAWYLDINLDDITNLLSVFVPKRGNASSFNFDNAFNNELIHPSGVFSVQQEFDEKYVLVPLRFARNLMDYEAGEVTSVEVFTTIEADEEAIERDLQKILGNNFVVKNRFQQNEALYKVMRSEKLAIFLILAFILVLASFNMVGSLSILIVEKLKDIAVLKSMGANKQLVAKIFTAEGMLISLLGSILGLVFGFVLLWIQQEFGLVRLGGGTGDFIIDAYPVRMLWLDFLWVFLTVIFIGFLATWYPVRYLTRKFEAISLR